LRLAFGKGMIHARVRSLDTKAAHDRSPVMTAKKEKRRDDRKQSTLGQHNHTGQDSFK
jgi:hypothetical protein